MPTTAEIANRLKDLRKKKGVTAEVVAKNVGVTTAAIINYETGIRMPRDAVKKALAEYYKVSVDHIFFT